MSVAQELRAAAQELAVEAGIPFPKAVNTLLCLPTFQQCYSLEEVAEVFQISRSRAAIIQDNAIHKLKHPRIAGTLAVYI